MSGRLVSSLLVSALLGVLPARAQENVARAAQRFIDPINGLSLEQAIARGLEQEPSLRAARSEVDVARAMRFQASLRPNPTVSIERREEPAGMDNQTTVAVEWPLELFRRGGRVAVADREVETVRMTVADRERLVAAEVRMRYGDVVAAVRDLGLLEELVGTITRQRDLLRARVEEGASPALDRDLLSVELRRLEADRLLQTGRAEAALIELKRTLGLPPDAVLHVRDGLEDLVGNAAAPVANAATAGGFGQRPDVREAAARVEVAEARIGRMRAEARFDVSLFANYMRMNAGFPQQAFGPGGGLEPIRGLFHYVSAGATITLPLFNRNQGEIAAAEAAHRGAVASVEAARLTAQSEVAAASARYEHARQAVAAYGTSRTLSRQNLTVVTQTFELGRLTIFEVLAEQRRYLDVERAYTETLKTAYDAQTALSRATGGQR